MVVTMSVAGLAEVAVGSALAGGIIGGVGVKVHDMLKAGSYIEQRHLAGNNSTQIQVAAANLIQKKSKG